MDFTEGTPSESALGRIGFYGCSARLVRVARPKKPGKPPQSFVVECPACERTHVIKPMWRERLPTDQEPEVSLP
jgi:hypothetical protein